MSNIDIESAPINVISKKIGSELKAWAKRNGGIKALIEKSGVPRSTLSRLFSGKPVSTEVFLRVLRSLERFDVLNMLAESPGLTPIEKLNAKNSRSKVEGLDNSNAPSDVYGHVKMADPKTILDNLGKKP